MKSAAEGCTIVFESVSLDKLWAFPSNGSVELVEDLALTLILLKLTNPYLFDPVLLGRTACTDGGDTGTPFDIVLNNMELWLPILKANPEMG